VVKKKENGEKKTAFEEKKKKCQSIGFVNCRSRAIWIDARIQDKGKKGIVKRKRGVWNYTTNNGLRKDEWWVECSIH
jgi:hypothetical protein